ncbi:MAG TPA: hypothetical protein VGM30_20045 [Puia sp.]|jgi:hypothetical protein
MNIEEIQAQCESMSNEQLLLVVNNKRLYTEKIVRVAYQEIGRRRLSKEEVKVIEKKHARKSRIITGDIHTDILLFEKIGVFFICIPFFGGLLIRDYRRKGYVLKTRQIMYFNLLGLTFLLADVFLGMNHLSLLTGIIIWIFSFLPTYYFNEYYFRQRIIRWLEARTQDPDEAEKG